MVDIALETREQAAILAVLDHFGEDFAARGGDAAPGQRERAHLPGGQGRLRGRRHRRAPSRCSPTSTGSRASTRRRSTSAGLIHARQRPLRVGAPHRCARSSSRSTRTASPSSSTAATTASRTWPTWRSGASRTSRRSTTTPTTSTSASPRTRSACPTRCSRRRGRCSRRASTRRPTRSSRSSTASFGKTPLAPDVLLLHAMIDLKSCQFDERARDAGQAGARPTARSRPRSRRCSRIPRSASRFYRRLLSKRSIGDAARSDHRAAQDRPALLSSSTATSSRSIARPGCIPERGRGVGRADRAREGRSRRLERDRGGAAGARRRGAAPAGHRRSGDGEPRGRSGRRRPGARRGWATSRAGRSRRRPRRRWRWRPRRASCAPSWSPRPARSPNKALVDLDKRLRELLRRARLTHIDAVIGKKKKLEIEIANLREGRYPADLFAHAAARGADGRRRGILAVRR